MERRKPVFYFTAEGGEICFGQEACTEQEAREKLRAAGVRGRLDFLIQTGCYGCCHDKDTP